MRKKDQKPINSQIKLHKNEREKRVTNEILLDLLQDQNTYDFQSICVWLHQ